MMLATCRPFCASTHFLLILAVAGMFLASSDAFAGGITLSDCAKNGGFSSTAVSGPIVYCVQTTIQNSVTGALSTMSDYFKNVVTAMLVLSVTMHGARMLTGERGITSKSIVHLLKIVFVSVFCYNLGGFANTTFNIMNELLQDAVAGYKPWTMIDNIMGTVLGFGPGVAMFQGLAWLVDGLLSGATTSETMSMVFIVAFLELILFFIEIIYTFLTSYIVVAFMVILSPMFVPMIVFQVSERYFRKWLDVIIGAMLIPVMLFAALLFSLKLYVTLLGNVFAIIAPGYNFTLPLNPANPPDFSAFWKMDQPVYSMTMGVDANYTNQLNNSIGRVPGDSKNVPTAHTTIDPMNRGSFDMNSFHPPGISFGKHDKTISKELMFALISLWIYTMIIKQLIEKMPEVAQEIAGVSIGIALRPAKLKERVAEMKSTAAGTLGGATGALAGGQLLGGVTGNVRAHEAGAIGGAVLGDVLARKAVGG